MSERFDDALIFAARLHRKQVRKQTGIPYISHLLAVTALAIEDQSDNWPGGASGLRREISQRDAEASPRSSRAVPDTDIIPKPPWRGSKERYLEHLIGASREVLLVACCDKLHNLRSTLADCRIHGEALWKRFNAGKAEQLWF